MKGLLGSFFSLLMIQNIYNPAIIKPKLLKVLTGSLNKPSETFSHHLEASPIRFAESTDWIKPNELRPTKVIINNNETVKAM